MSRPVGRESITPSCGRELDEPLNSVALALVLVAAMIHATWNLLVKKSGGGRMFVWLFATISSTVLVPAAIVLVIVQQHEINALKAGFICGTALLHFIYFMLLQRGYQTGELSLVYPLARGLAPTLSTLGAVLVLSERPSSIVIGGLLLIVLGIVLLTLRTNNGIKHPSTAVFYGVMTGVSISVYTVWDKYTVDHLAVPPLVLEAFAGLGISLILTPTAMRRSAEVKRIWRDHKTEVIGVSILAPLSYILILTAMSFTPLSYVAPCREVSILFAAILAARFLGEGNSIRRICAACLIVGGVIALAVG
jgi:drug/metabolite transporter (DMT)-like permease